MSQPTLFDALRDVLAEDGEDRLALGMDLGTTKSCVASARYESGELTCECLGIDEPGQPAGMVVVPSVVAVVDGEPIVGHAARRLARTRGHQRQRGYFSETKNEIGLRHTYARAPEGFRNATEIAGHLLGHLMDASGMVTQPFDEPVVITVPASFHGAQRRATLEAADTGLETVSDVRLLDEPYAVMLDLLFRSPESVSHHMTEHSIWMVFDFGGGTCDVALFTLANNSSTALAPRLLATSRYHRIGGGDIDRAIVHGHLIPTLLDRYGIHRTDVPFGDKRKRFEPALLPVAEQLKHALCRRLRAMEDDGADDPDVEAVAATDISIQWNGRELWLSDPRLDRQTFERLLRPFLDPHPGASSSDEYVERESIFQPILQVLAQSGISRDEVDVVVMAGSSSLVPQVEKALDAFFPLAEVLPCGGEADLPGAIARGAALQALSLAVTGEPLIAPVTSAELSLRTRQGMLTLVQAGESLPACSRSALTILAPESSPTLPIDLSIEVLADNERVVGRSIWQLEPPIHKGEPLTLAWSLDENQCLSLHLQRQEAEDENGVFEDRYDAPLSHIDQGHLARTRLLEAEELVRTGSIPTVSLGEMFTQMARDAASIGQHEKALHCITCAMQHAGNTCFLLNLRAIYLDDLGDADRAEEVYRQAAGWSVARFNLALFLSKRRRLSEALEVIDSLIAEDPSAMNLVLKGDIVAALGNDTAARLHYQDAVSRVADPSALTACSLGWLASGARRIGQADLAERFGAMSRERSNSEQRSANTGALLPDVASELVSSQRAARCEAMSSRP